MSIQSTTYLTRNEAEELFIQQYITKNRERLQREVKLFTNSELEDELESTYDNYRIEETTNV